MSETLLQFAAFRQPVIIAAAAMAGTTAPVTLAGTMALVNAEILATIAVTQMICPGLPVVYGSQSCSADMKTGQIAIGSAEGALCYKYTAQLGKAYGLPCRGGGALTDSRVLNAQAGAESILTLLAAASEKMNLIFQSAGIMDGYNSISYEKLMFDFEIIKIVQRYLSDIDVSETTLALDVIDEVGIAGEFLSCGHTFAHMRKEHFFPDLALRGCSAEDPSTVYAQNIENKLHSMLADYEMPPIEKTVKTAMEETLYKLGYDKDCVANLTVSESLKI